MKWCAATERPVRVRRHEFGHPTPHARGQGPARVALGFRMGNPDTFEERAGVSGGTSLYGYNLAIGRVDSEGILSINNDFSNTTLAARFDLDPHDTLQLMTTVRYIDSRFHFPTHSGDRIDRRDNMLDPRAYTDSRRLILGPRAVYQPAAWWRPLPATRIVIRLAKPIVTRRMKA